MFRDLTKSDDETYSTNNSQYRVDRTIRYDVIEETCSVTFPVAEGAQVALTAMLNGTEIFQTTLDAAITAFQEHDRRRVETRVVISNKTVVAGSPPAECTSITRATMCRR